MNFIVSCWSSVNHILSAKIVRQISQKNAECFNYLRKSAAFSGSL